MKRPPKPVASSAKRRSSRHSGGITFEHVRAVALLLPGVEDGTSYGTRALKVRGKLLARVHQSIDCLVLRADFLDRQILMQSEPDTYFITDHYRDYPMVLMRFATADAQELPSLIERAWRLVAPKTLLATYDSAR
jgi:hypothetical protein